MKKTVIISLSLLISMAVAFSARAQTASTDSGQTTLEALQKQIQLLLSQIGSLQKEVTSLRSAPPAPATSATTPTVAPTTPRQTILRPPIPTTIPPGLYDPLEVDESEVSETEAEFVPPPVLTRSLFRGSRGEDVRQLQEFLAQDQAIYPEGAVTGYYGAGTAAAVRKWQAKYGLPAVGIVGRQTIAKFRALSQTGRPITDPRIVDPRPAPCAAVYSPERCPAGEERYVTSRSESCGAIYACRPATNIKKEICPALPTVDACPAGEERVVTYKSEQCGVYYACKPREAVRAKDTIATLKKISSIQTDNRYNVILNDPDGIQKFAVYSVKGAEIQLGYPACRKEWTTPVISASGDEFPLKLVLADCAGSQYSAALSTSVVVQPISEGLTFPYTFSNGKIVYSSEEARSYCYANPPGSSVGIAGECETKFGIVYTTRTTTATNRAVYSADSFAACMARYGFAAEAKQIKTWAQSSEPIPWAALSSAAQTATQKCESEYYGQQTVESGATLCSDGRDNDGDGYIDSADPSCAVTITTGQKEQVWNSFGLKSWIRTDADSGRIEQSKAACASVKPNSNVWLPNAGLASSADFGMPDASKCQRAAVCTASQIFDGAACVTSTTTTTGTTQCSDGRDNDGDGKIDYPTDTGCYSSADADESFPCPTGYKPVEASTNSSSYCQSTTNSTQCQPVGGGTTYTCGTTTTTTTNQCSDGRDNDGDGLVDYPSDTGCYSREDNDETPGTTTTTSSCDSALAALLGTGCHYMYNDSAGNQIYCDGNMTKSAKRGDATTTTGCSPPTTAGGGSTYTGDANSCPGFAYSRWDQQNRRYCQLNTEQKCDYDYPSYLTASNYTAAKCPTHGSTATTAYQCSDGIDNDSDGQIDYPNDSSCWGREDNDEAYPASTTTTTSSAACSDGRDNDGDGLVDYPSDTGCYGPADTDETAPASTTTTTTTTSCVGTPVSCTDSAQCSAAGYYWYDASCHSSPQTTTTTTTCPSGQYWSGTACVSSTTSTDTHTTTSSCPSGYHSMAGYCMSDSDPSKCQPTGGGAIYTCSGATPTAGAYNASVHAIAQFRAVLKNLEDSIRGLLVR